MTSRVQVLTRRYPIESRDRVSPPEGCHLTSGLQPREVLLQSLSGPQEKWADETCRDSMGWRHSLQDGRYLNLTGPSKNGRLDGKSGSERLLLHNPNSPSTSTLPEVTVEGQSYQFLCLLFSLSSALWTFTKVTKPLMALLKAWDVRIMNYNSGS